MKSEHSDLLLKELAILTNDSTFLNTCEADDNTQPIRAYCDGHFQQILQTEQANVIFSDSQQESGTFASCLINNVDRYLHDGGEGTELDVLLVGASCLQLFVQNNWIGPCPTTFSPKDLIPGDRTTQEKFRDTMEAELSVDGEPVYNKTTYLEFLLVAKVILVDCKDKLQNLQTSEWWTMRCLNIQQQILDDKANSLRETFIQLIDLVQRKEPLMVFESLRDIQMMFHLEAGYLSHTFYMYREAREHFTTARKLSGLKVELTGAMGKRTRYQQTEKAQLILEVTRETADSINNSTETTLDVQERTSVVPKNLNLEDDTVLDAISFTDDIQTTQLSAIEQSLIMGLMENHKRSRASDDQLLEEEVEAYISYILVEARSWSVSCAALFVRSVMEKKGSRRVDRSMRQVEELFNQTRREEPSAGQRLQLFYSVPISPIWKVQGQLAEILLSLGAIGSAVDIYEKLHLWEQAIACYQRLGKVEKAETLIREQLEIKETPNLWCFLGDITRDMSHYEKAWEMSKHRSARAQRCMGYLYFGKEDYKSSIECFQKSLMVNALQIPVWFTYGCAAMAAEDFNLAAIAFRRCVNIDYDNYEAWGNLAAAFVKLKEKRKAFVTIKDAIKCNYENWRLWDNMLLISTDCGEFRECIQAYHRLLDLKDKWEDVQVLEALVTAVLDDLPDAQNRPSSFLLQELKELFGRITSKVTNNAEIWRSYAKLSRNDVEKSLQFLQKAHRCVTQTKDWEKTEDQCEKVTEQALQLAEAYQQAVNHVENQTRKLQFLSSAKLMLKGVFSKIKQEQTNPVTQEVMSDKVKVMCSNLEGKIQNILEETQKLKN